MPQEGDPLHEKTIRRPSLFVIRGILDNVVRGNDHTARFQDLAKCTPELRNRMKLLQYLKLLVTDLGWLEIEGVKMSRTNPTRRRRERHWKLSRYRITDLGKSFLQLFPYARVLPPADDGLPSPEEQAKNWKEWLGEGNS